MKISRIEKMISIPTPSGRECKVYEYISKCGLEYGADCIIDKKGNAIIMFEHNVDFTVTFLAHVDQIAFVITKIEGDKARFISLSRIQEENLLGCILVFPSGEFGVVQKDDSIYVDISGACNVSVGDFIVYYPQFKMQEKYMYGTALDNKVACSLLIDLFNNFSKYTNINVKCIFTVQEEVGARGVSNVDTNDKNGIVIALDVTPSTNCYKKTSVIMGEGVAIKVCDAGNIINKDIVELLLDIAERNGIKAQLEIIDRGGTDAASLDRKRRECEVAAISIPCDYGHSPCEKICINDVEAMEKIIVNICGYYDDRNKNRS